MLETLYKYYQNNLTDKYPMGSVESNISVAIVIDMNGNFIRLDKKDKNDSFLVPLTKKVTSGSVPPLFYGKGDYIYGKYMEDFKTKISAVYNRFNDDRFNAVIKFYDIDGQKKMKEDSFFKEYVPDEKTIMGFQIFGETKFIAEDKRLYSYAMDNELPLCSEKSICSITGKECYPMMTTFCDSGMASLSSFQAAGRCNREGKKEISEVCVFDFEGLSSTFGKEGNSKLSAYNDVKHYPDLLSRDTIDEYFKRFLDYVRTTGVDTKNITGKSESLDFEDINDDFSLIDDGNTVDVFVPYKDGRKLINKLIKYGPTVRLMRKLGRYTVSVTQKKYKEMVESGIITFCGEKDDIPIIDNTIFYDDKTGILDSDKLVSLII